MNKLKTETINQLETRLQRKISYSSISPSIFMFLELRDVVIREKDSGRELLEVGRVRVHYSLFQLIKGNYGKTLKEISIVKSRLDLDTERDSDLITLFTSSGTDRNTSGINLPPVVLSGKNLSVKVKNGDNTFTLEKFFFEVSNKNQSLKFSSKGIIKGSINSRWIRSAHSKFRYSGIVNRSLSDFNSRLSLKSISTDLFSLHSLSLQIKRSGDNLVIRKVEDSSPLDMELNYNISGGEAKVSVISENFIPSDYFFSLPENRTVKDWISGAYTADLTAYYSSATGDLSYRGKVDVAGKNRIMGGTYSFSTELSGNNRSVDFSYVKASTSYGSFYYKGNFYFDRMLPDGFLSIRRGRYKNIVLDTNLVFNLSKNNLDISSRRLSLNGINFLDLKAELTKYSGDFDFSAVFSIENAAGIKNRSTVEGNLQYAPELSMQLNLAADSLPLDPFNTYKDKIPTKNISLSTEGFLTTDFSKFSFSLLNVYLEDKLNSNNNLVFSCTGNNEGISITGIKALWKGEELTGNILADRQNGEYTARGDLVFNSYPYNFIVNAGEEGVYIRGNYGLLISTRFTGPGLSFTAQSTSFPVPLKDSVSEISFNSSGYYLNSSLWKVLLDKVSLKNLPLPIPENKIEFSGEITRNTAYFKDITFRDTLSVLYGESSLEYDFKNNTYSGSAFFTDDENKESYSASIQLSGTHLSLETAFAGAPIERFKKSSLSGLVTGKVTADGPRKNPDFNVSVRLNKAIYASIPIELNTSLNFKEDILNIQDFSMKYIYHSFSGGKGHFDTKTGEYSFSSRLEDNIGGHLIDSELSLSGNFFLPENTGKISFSELTDLPFKGRFSSGNAAVDGKKAEDWSFDIARDEKGNFSFTGGPADSIQGYIGEDGTFRLTSTEDFPVKTEAAGVIKGGKIDVLLKNTRLNLTVLNIVKITGFRFAGGAAYGNVRISGELRDPDFNGVLKVKGAVGELSYLVDPIEPFDTVITFNEKNMHVKKAVLAAGGANVTAEGDFTFSKWLPVDYQLDFLTEKAPGIHLLYKINSIGLGINGYADGKLRIKGAGAKTDFSGNLKVDNCIVTIGQPEKSRKENGETSGTSLNMSFTTGRKVEVLWPSTNLPIIKANTEPEQNLRVTMDGISGTYSIKGNIAVKYGEIYYFQRNFYLTSGTIIFNENEESFDPLVDFKAQIREVDSKGEVVNVYMYLDKTPLSKFAPRFESDPALPTVEIMAMLGSNVFAQLGSEKVDITSALVLTGDLVSQFSIVRGFEQKVKDIFKLDLFSIRTQMIQNIILDRFTGSGINDNTSSDLFGRYLDNTTIYLGKYFGNSLFLQTMVQLGNVNSFSEDYINNESLKIQTKVNLEWETPFFLLDFSVEPDFADPISSLDNTSLSFSWGFSY